MEKIQILLLGVIIGMFAAWIWWKISEIGENKEIRKIFDKMEKEMSEERGAKVIMNDDVKELVTLTSKAGVFEDSEGDKKD